MVKGPEKVENSGVLVYIMISVPVAKLRPIFFGKFRLSLAREKKTTFRYVVRFRDTAKFLCI